MRVLMLMSSRSTQETDALRLELHVEAFAAPYYVFLDAGAEVVLATPNGGFPAIGRISEAAEADTASRRLRGDGFVLDELSETMPLERVRAEDFDSLYVTGGHGALWDLGASRPAAELIAWLACAERPMALVGHGPAALLAAAGSDGAPLVNGRALTAASNAEEEACAARDELPYLLQDELSRRGASYRSGADWQPHVVQDGLLITGQNQSSATQAAKALLRCAPGR